MRGANGRTVALSDLLQMADDGCPHADVEHDVPPVVDGGREPPAADVHSDENGLVRTIAEQVKAIPELVHWGETSEGYSIFRQANGVGGHTYWSDEIGGGVRVWDTSLISPHTLRVCLDLEIQIAQETRRIEMEEQVKAIDARLEELSAANAAATGWGAAVGARWGEMKHLVASGNFLRRQLGMKLRSLQEFH